MNEKCEICGKEATVQVRDSYRAENPVTDWHEFAPGDSHFYCDEHKTKPTTHNVSMEKIGEIYGWEKCAS